MSFDLKLVNGSLNIKDGDLDIVEGSDKLVQDVLKLVSTPLGSNPFFPSYGCPINKALIGKTYDQTFVEDIATNQLRSSIERLQQWQLEQLKQNQVVTADEQLAVVEDIRVTQARNDPRYYLTYLTIISKAFQRIPISFTIDTV